MVLSVHHEYIHTSAAVMVANEEVKLDVAFKALIVDDDLDVLSTIADLLRGRGYDVEIAQSAEEGLARLGASPFQLVISDYKLPGNTGAWMLQQAGKAGLLGSAKVLLMTAEVNPEGVSGVKILRKPFELDLFLREVCGPTVPNAAEQLALATIDGDLPQPPETK
jgi:CheY-like chemotaxis protein